jgi:hypothetical protein
MNPTETGGDTGAVILQISVSNTISISHDVRLDKQ